VKWPGCDSYPPAPDSIATGSNDLGLRSKEGIFSCLCLPPTVLHFSPKEYTLPSSEPT
jgi:hypothetical protein